ncbi:Aspartate aminotransferase [Jeotgalicoccus aerolatus]|uniref:Aminotransferase n=1 Tax=Jeotgalicoccus aerolatus TaxID=709510 RepID=A0ABS4HLJ5_9STAP|nr:pyridoxal phosphate-dependent aminotransferase [Jeotgalicoccus aerolatus]MBP1951806.1 aspartate aminotransferase [Jeotgalicoccus aerolatus]GGD94645.1 aspartate aminotransferase [Jeotgalicoccus aerolatus]CAD2075121.1 Aspartate aminotransferase [Jeotgalicoccus aerolatus]
MELSKKVKSITPSQTIEITNTARQLRAAGVDVISLSAGEPDFNTPDEIIDAVYDASKKGRTKYTASKGLPALRQAIAEKMQRDNNLTYDENQIYVGNGAKQVLYNIFMATLNEGDEVIVPSPYWVSYTEQIKIAGGEPVTAVTTEDTDFKLTPELLKAHMTEKTKMLVLNSPNNPTGTVYTKDELQQLADVLAETEIIIVVDEIYEVLTYGTPHVSIASLNDKIKAQTIIVNGVSKSHAMTGWRVGYACGDAELISALASLTSQSTTSVAEPSQYGAIAAYNMDPKHTETYRKTFEARRDNAFQQIESIPYMTCIKPEGAFYLFPHVQKCAEQCGYDTVDAFVKDILREKHVAFVPGSGFGAPEYARISYSIDEASFNEAIRRIKDFIEEKTNA